MKNVLKLFLLLISFGILVSCKHCIECSFNSGGTLFESGKVCGTRGKVNDVRIQYEASAAASGTTATCIEE